jgi:dihydroxyacetone kinase DhaKLM complex PTS-EIIA-like component DhaM
MKDDELLVLMNTVRAIASVQMVVELTNEKIKNKQHLIF